MIAVALVFSLSLSATPEPGAMVNVPAGPFIFGCDRGEAFTVVAVGAAGFALANTPR